MRRGCVREVPSIVFGPCHCATSCNRPVPHLTSFALVQTSCRWYDANARIVWPCGEAPTLEQTKKHAKGMRRLEDIPAYFREYRLKCKGQDHTEVGGNV